MNRHVVISGCSGGGKSSVLHELSRRGYRVVEEPGRRVVESELRSGGVALPWRDMQAFLERAAAMARADLAAVQDPEHWVFFDRGLVDAAAGLAALANQPLTQWLDAQHHYHPLAFLTPPWPDIYVQDAARRHGFDAAVDEYERLVDAYRSLGYAVSLLPFTSVAERADFIVDSLARSPGRHAGNDAASHS